MQAVPSNIKDRQKDRERPDRLAQAKEDLKEFYNDPYVYEGRKVKLKEFMEQYKLCGCNGAQACRNLGVSYQVYYNIKKKNPELIEEAKAAIKDKEKEFIYNRLLLLVAAGNVPATIFACKAILGMKETQDINIEQGGINIKDAIEEIKREMNEPGD